MNIEITCPHCRFSKLVPRAGIPAGVRWATCPRCRQRFEFVLSGVETTPDREPEDRPLLIEEPERRSPSPWERRSEIGLWKGIYLTFKAVLFSPAIFFSGLEAKAGIKEPLAFGILLGSLGAMVGLFWQFLLMSGPILAMGADLFGGHMPAAVFLGILITSPFLVLAGLFVASLITHILLVLVRGGSKGFEGTFRVFSYSQATQVLSFIPFVGGLIGTVWFLIVQIIGLKEIHEISYLRLFTAFLIPVVLMVAVAMAVVFPVFSRLG